MDKLSNPDQARSGILRTRERWRREVIAAVRGRGEQVRAHTWIARWRSNPLEAAQRLPAGTADQLGGGELRVFRDLAVGELRVFVGQFLEL
jgi:hypothetical protein